MDPNWVVSTRFQAIRVLAVGDDSGHHPCTRATQVGAPPPNILRREISRPTAVGHARIGPVNAATTGTLGRLISPFSSHSRPTHTSLPPFLNPLNSFPWSFFADSSPFQRYDERKFGRRLDRIFRPPPELLNQGKSTVDPQFCPSTLSFILWVSHSPIVLI